MKITAIFFFFSLLFFPLLSQAQNIDATQSKVSFDISNMAFNTVEGTITGMSGTIQFDPKNSSDGSLDVCIDASSIDTGNDKRDEHLKAEDFFDVSTHPEICFTSSNIRSVKGGFLAEGKLNLKGVSKDIELPFTFQNQQFIGNLELDRLDYNIGPNGGFMIGKTVELKIICRIK